ncbi:MAG: MBOAT family protein [Lachnospiraceae bacterium]|uniref:MBOAT family protein n=1 Tax=Candidatus Weimeria bifida TaxID=2599074 RepID=A0A6N7J137_9FIRM|nr:MBOAT family protein [Candidatus Weimeria bifida]RRF96958.1 MAG: MBOAT family protein [Lachnospiraceae bacterium]
MVFSSVPFLFIFLPIVLILYSCIRNIKAQNALLILASLFFYGYGEPVFVLAMIASVFVNWVLAVFIADFEKNKKIFLVIAVIANLAFLGVFKYAGFAVKVIDQVTGMNIPVPEITLPIGISFFTFQVLSYVIDVYRDPSMVQRRFTRVLLYVSFFPQLIAGPIVKYHDIYKYLDSRHQTVAEVAGGIRRFILGLSKKLFLANTMGLVADKVFALPKSDLSAPAAWLGAVAYLFQIFFDFSGYSDMAIGLGAMFGFPFLENFDHPYIATSIKDFWRRWHISLSTWFRDYLYIPLGGNRKGKVRTEVNKLIVFFFTGLWHGASWNFVLWGMIHGISLVAEDCVKYFRERNGKVTRRKGPFSRFLGWFYTIIIVTVAFVFFRADTLSDGGVMIAAMFAGGSGNLTTYNTLHQILSPYVITMMAASVAACFPILKSIDSWALNAGEKQTRVVRGLSYVLSLILLAGCVLNIANASYNPFIYFRF